MSDYRDIKDDDYGKKRLSFDVILRRYFRIVQQSRIMADAKDLRFHAKPPSRRKRKESANRREKIRRSRRGY